MQATAIIDQGAAVAFSFGLDCPLGAIRAHARDRGFESCSLQRGVGVRTSIR
jgi:hypothetical protein